MSFNEIDQQRFQRIIQDFVDKRRPHPTIRDQVDLFSRWEEQSVTIYEVRPIWNQPEEKTEIHIAKAKYVKSRRVWKVFLDAAGPAMASIRLGTRSG